MRQRSKRKFLELKKHEDHGDEAWMVSYADMVTLLFGFFVILYSFSTIDEKKYEKMSDEIASAFKSKELNQINDSSSEDISEDARKIRALRMVVSMLNLGGSLTEGVTAIEKSFEKKESSKALKALSTEMQVQGAVVTSGSGTEARGYVDLILSETSLFKKGGFDIDPAAVPYIKGLATDISASADVAEIVVSGHTDSVNPSPSAAYRSNFTLSSMRAGSVAEALIRFGVDANKIRVAGLGSLQPLKPEYDAAGKPIAENMAANRRVQITVRRELKP